MSYVDYLTAILIGVFSSGAASLVFLFFLSKVKPKVCISKRVAKTKNVKGQTEYRLKIINRTPRPIINVRAKLHSLRDSPVPGGVVKISKEIPLWQGEAMQIERFDPADKEANYAFNFSTAEDLETLWDDNTYLRLTIFGVDSFSGFGSVVTQYFHKKRTDLIQGDFEFGNSLEVK